jgi:hypothetical protein
MTRYSRKLSSSVGNDVEEEEVRDCCKLLSKNFGGNTEKLHNG